MGHKNALHNGRSEDFYKLAHVARPVRLLWEQEVASLKPVV